MAGEWFVDKSCIDCGICRWVAPRSFADAEDTAYVGAQPASAAEEGAAGRAAVACPVGSIGGPAELLRAAARQFPYPVLPDVWFCGWANRDSYGAAAWLIVRPEGNVLIDVPRPAPALVQGIEKLGGVRQLVLTHRDDVAGHGYFAQHFGTIRVMHRLDVDADTAEVEQLIDQDTPLGPDLRLVTLPGHTRGSIGLSWREEVLFSGDHVWGAGPRGRHAEGGGPGHAGSALGAGRSVCWWSWPQQIRSMERLLEIPFAAVLPGHGRPWFGGHQARVPALEALIGWMKGPA